MKAVCVGHSTYDITIPVDEYPKENIKYRIKEKVECGGGQASNGAYLLAKWGLDTTIVTIIGKDYYGDKIVKEFTEIGANTDYIEQRENYMTTNSYIVANKENGSRTILSSKDKPIRKLSKNIDLKADIILIDGEHPETAHEILDNNPNAISVIDAGRLNEDTKALGKKVSYLVCSHEFAEEFTNLKTTKDIDTLIEIHKKLEEYFKTKIIITLEEKGSFTKIDEEYQIIPSKKVKAVDSTGAGDIFHGAFTYFIAQNFPLKKAIQLASITSAISVTRVGSRLSIPNIEEVMNYDNTI